MPRQLPLHFSPSANVTSCNVTATFVAAAGTLNARQSTIPVVSPPTRFSAVKLECWRVHCPSLRPAASKSSIVRATPARRAMASR